MQQKVERSKVIVLDQFRAAKSTINKNNATRGLFFFVALPTLLATIYFFLIASDIYVTETKFSVNIEGRPTISAGGLGALMPGLSSAGNMGEAMIVKEYIQSPQLVVELQKQMNLKAVYDNRKADFLTRIPSNLTREEFAERYSNMIDVVMDEASGIVTLKVKAFTPQDSEKLAVNILNLTENFVNNMSRRMQDDSLSFSKRELDNAEAQVIAITNEISAFRNKNQNFDPSSTAKNIVGITSKLEDKLAETNTELANLRNYMQPNNPKITSLEAEAASLRSQIDQQGGRLANSKGSELADTATNYEILKSKLEFAEKRYQLAVAAYQGAEGEAMKKSKYLLRIVEPATPEEATEPKRIKNIITVFFGCLIGYMLLSLIIASIKDHVRP